MTEKTPPLPAQASAWLGDVGQRIRSLPQEQRTETLTGLADHLAELIASGVNGPEAVARLGTARDAAEAAFQQYEQQSGVDALTLSHGLEGSAGRRTGSCRRRGTCAGCPHHLHRGYRDLWGH